MLSAGLIRKGVRGISALCLLSVVAAVSARVVVTRSSGAMQSSPQAVVADERRAELPSFPSPPPLSAKNAQNVFLSYIHYCLLSNFSSLDSSPYLPLFFLFLFLLFSLVPPSPFPSFRLSPSLLYLVPLPLWPSPTCTTPSLGLPHKPCVWFGITSFLRLSCFFLEIPALSALCACAVRRSPDAAPGRVRRCWGPAGVPALS